MNDLAVGHLKVLAFMQNMWLHNPGRARKMIARDQTGKLRGRLINYALFAGCVSGRRLKQGLGEEWCGRIIWDEASPIITERASDCPPPDRAHIASVLDANKPDLVVCFTKPAQEMIRALCQCPMICVSHPAARQADVMDQLKKLRGLLDQADAKTPSGGPPTDRQQLLEI